jgi:ribose transport system substrate-binding protein
MVQVYHIAKPCYECRNASTNQAKMTVKSMKLYPLDRRLNHLRSWLWGFAAVVLMVTAAALLHRYKEPLTIAVIPRTCGTWLWEGEHTGVARAAQEYGINVYWNAPMREDDVQGQIDIFMRVLKNRVRGVIVSPVEALPLRTCIHKAVAKGTPVVVVGTDLGLAPGKELAYVLTDERAGSQMAASRVDALLHGQGSIAILGISNQLSSTAERARSLEKALAKGSPAIHVAFRSLALSTVSQEQQGAEKLLAEGPHVDAIIALTEASTRGAFYALTEFKRTGATPLIGFDQNLLAPIRTGEIDSVIMQNTNEMGRAAMKLMEEEIRGGATQRFVIVQPQLVTRENIDSDAVKQTLDLAWFVKSGSKQ